MLDPRIIEAAGSLMKNDAFRAACEKIEERYTRAIVTSEYDQRENREVAYRQLRALRDLLLQLRRYWEEGEAEGIATARKDNLAT